MSFYYGLSSLSEKALGMTGEEVVRCSPFPVEVFEKNEEMINSIAEKMLEDYSTIMSKGKKRAVFIVPVGPVGQYDIMAEKAIKDNIDLSGLILLGMDEYLTPSCKWIPREDPLSFRSHIDEHLINKLETHRRPECYFPKPDDINEYTDIIKEHGVDVTYAGVGITGHLAFNDPLEGYEDPDLFASLETRIVQLREMSITINSVTAARGNTLRMPKFAITVGMKEILSAEKIRIFMNRDWHCAALRRMLFGDITGAFPASLVQRHCDVSVGVTRGVLDMPEPVLR